LILYLKVWIFFFDPVPNVPNVSFLKPKDPVKNIRAQFGEGERALIKTQQYLPNIDRRSWQGEFEDLLAFQRSSVLGAQKAALFKMFLRSGVLPRGLIIQDLPEYARNQFPEFMDPCVRVWAGVKDIIIPPPDVLNDDSMGDWVRDLTNEGIEPNPGPPKFEVRYTSVSYGTNRSDSMWYNLQPFCSMRRYELVPPMLSNEPEPLFLTHNFAKDLFKMQEFFFPVTKVSEIRRMYDSMSRSLVVLERVYSQICIQSFRLEIGLRDADVNVHCRIRCKSGRDFDRLEQSVLLLSGKKFVIELRRYCLIGDDLDLIISMYSRKNVKLHFHLIYEILVDGELLKLNTTT